MQEIMSGFSYDDLPDDQKENGKILLEKINLIRTKWNKPMTVTSGYRSMEHHLEIYAAKGITDQSKIPMKSKHLFMQACDISDPERDLQKWCKDNVSFLEEIGVWMEDFSKTPNWCHFQSVPYGSYTKGKNIWFIP